MICTCLRNCCSSNLSTPAIPRGKEIAVYCAAGQRSYYATRTLLQNGFQVKNISGGMTLYNSIKQFLGT
jgi:rhodanese-related sulfurtransferase